MTTTTYVIHGTGKKLTLVSATPQIVPSGSKPLAVQIPTGSTVKVEVSLDAAGVAIELGGGAAAEWFDTTLGGAGPRFVSLAYTPVAYRLTSTGAGTAFLG